MKVFFGVLVLLISCVSVKSDIFSDTLCTILDFLTSDEISPQCHKQMQTVCKNSDLFWQFFDASSKWPNSGMSYSDNKDYGNFPQCMHIDQQIENSETRIKGKYCAFSVALLYPFAHSVPSPFALSISNETQQQNLARLLEAKKDKLNELIEQKVLAMQEPYLSPVISDDEMYPFALSLLSSCVPDACTPREVANFFIWGQLENVVVQNVSLITFTNAVPCRTADSDSDWTDADYAFVVVCGVVASLIVICTTYDLILYYTEKAPKNQIFVCFSLLTNGRKLLHISRTTTGGDQISCLNGIRYVSMFWVICGHGYVAYEAIPINNLKETKPLLNSYASAIYTSGPIAVDTFFFLSGFLLAFNYIKVAPKISWLKQVLSIPMMMLHRYLRLTPALIMVFLLSISSMRKLGNGPLWSSVTQPSITTCKKWWWSFLLYVQNYVNYNDMCLNHTWYLSADMQMFLLAPIVLIPMAVLIGKKETKKAFVATGVLTVILVIVPMIPRFADHSIKNVYDTHSRLNDYLVGIMFGAFLRLYKDKPFPFTKMQNLAIWIAVLAIDVGVLLFLYHYIIANYEHTSDTLFYGLYRPIWCVSLVWMIYSCYKGYGGIVNWVLSRPIFQVGARLSYCMYLLHGNVLMFWLGTNTTQRHFGQYAVFYAWCGHFVVTSIMALIWTLSFEAPMISIEKFLFGGAAKKGAKEVKKVENGDNNEAKEKV